MRRALIALLLVVAGGVAYWAERDAPVEVGARSLEAPVSGEIIQVAGVVERVLPDDNDGSRHQRFIIRVDADWTLLISHNIDLAPRIDDLVVGNVVEVRGEYEWNSRGGLIHWTHRDPAGRHESGWIKHRGRDYR